MNLSYIPRGKSLQIYEEGGDPKRPATYSGNFYEAADGSSFYLKSAKLYRNFHDARHGTDLRISFFLGDVLYEFVGHVLRAGDDRGMNLLLVEQQSEIEPAQRRRYDREALAIHLQLYEIAEQDIQNVDLRQFARRVVFTGVTADISTGGLCMVSKERLDSPSGSYFLIEFILNKKERFLLPAKLIRKGDHPKINLYRYEYGFIFVFDHLPQDRERLTTALFMEKFRLYRHQQGM